jgi:hypothetical protein
VGNRRRRSARPPVEGIVYLARESRPSYRGWYTLSVDTLRGWVNVLLLVALAWAGWQGYGVLENRYLEGKVSRVLREARDLEASVRAEGGARTYRADYESALEHLRQARALLDDRQLAGALRSAEQGRVVLASLLRQLHRLESSGEAQFISVQGAVEYRRGERGEWQSARVRDVLYAGDYVKTASSGSAEIMAIDGTVYTVRADTVILIGRTNLLGAETADRTINLAHGWVDLSTSLARSTVATPEAEARVEKDSTVVVAWDERLRLGKFAAYRGAMSVDAAAGGHRRLRQLEHVVQRGSELSDAQRLPAAPVPLDPSDDFEVRLESSDRLVLSWQPVAGADRYALQVARNRLFVSRIIDADDRRGTQATLGLRGDGAFVWRVAAYTRDGVLGPWSQPRRFRVLAAPLQAEDPLLTPGES